MRPIYRNRNSIFEKWAFFGFFWFFLVFFGFFWFFWKFPKKPYKHKIEFLFSFIQEKIQENAR